MAGRNRCIDSNSPTKHARKLGGRLRRQSDLPCHFWYARTSYSVPLTPRARVISWSLIPLSRLSISTRLTLASVQPFWRNMRQDERSESVPVQHAPLNRTELASLVQLAYSQLLNLLRRPRRYTLHTRVRMILHPSSDAQLVSPVMYRVNTSVIQSHTKSRDILLLHDFTKEDALEAGSVSRSDAQSGTDLDGAGAIDLSARVETEGRGLTLCTDRDPLSSWFGE